MNMRDLESPDNIRAAAIKRKDKVILTNLDIIVSMLRKLRITVDVEDVTR